MPEIYLSEDKEEAHTLENAALKQSSRCYQINNIYYIIKHIILLYNKKYRKMYDNYFIKQSNLRF